MVWGIQVSFGFFFRAVLVILLLDFQTCFGGNQTDIANSAGTKTFLDSLFNLYGENNGTSITPAKFKILLRNLSIGGVTLERTGKYCAYKGVHNGMLRQPVKTDSIADDKARSAAGSEKQASLTNVQHDHLHDRERRSGGHEKKEKVKENPKHSSHLEKHYQQCLTAHKIFEQYKLNENVSVTRQDFIRLCPALLHQVAGGYCIHRHNCSQPPEYYVTEVNPKMVWVYGFVAITIVSLASLCIIALIPCLQKGFYQRIMGYLVALAVGTLAGDALLHLIPHAFQSQTTGTLEADHKKTIWKACFVLLGMYAFFVVEQLMKIKTFFKNKKTQNPTKTLSIRNSEKGQSLKEIKDVHYSKQSDGDSLDHMSNEEKGSNDTHSAADVLPLNGEISPDRKSETELIAFPPGNDRTDHYDHDPHDHLEKHDHHKNPHDMEHNHGHSHGTIDNKTSIASVAWMVIVGDGFHNFSDGLAIGAAFAASYTSGISTAIAVFCHELPHELGDFAVLIKSGMSIRQAICYNLVSAVLSYFGLVIGIIIGNYSDDGKQFALALTAGLFLYVALASMLPELTSSIDDDVGDAWSFISPHLGILSGITIMLLISIFEDKF